MTEPWIGDPTEARPGTCAFALKPGDPVCGAPATVHILSESAIYGEVGLPTCDVHAPIARASGPFLGEHPYAADCSGRLGWWRPDGCTPADESGAL